MSTNNENIEYEVEYKASFRINGFDVDFPVNKVNKIPDVTIVDIEADKIEN